MRGFIVRVVLGFVVGVLVDPKAFALDRDRALSELHHTAWFAKDGAPTQIGSIAQTKDGFLWIASNRGLYRFDGVQFEAYRPQEGVRVPSYSFELLAPTPDGGLWVSFRTGALGFLKDGRITTFTRPDELPPAWISGLACDRAGRLFAGTQQGLFLREGTGWKQIGRDLAPSHARSLLVARDGTLWLGSDDGIFTLPAGATKLTRTGWTHGVVRRMAQAPDGRIWACADDGVRPVPRDEAAGADRGEIVRAEFPMGATFDRDGALWFAAGGEGIRRVRDPEKPGELEAFHEGDGLSSESAIQAFEDREGNIWITTARGIDRFRQTRVVGVRVPPEHHAFTLLAGEDGEIWAASILAVPLLRIRGDEVHVGSVRADVKSVYRDRQGTVWWGVNGIYRQRGSGFDMFPQPTTVWVMCPSESGGLWVCLGEDDILHFQDGVWERRPLPDGIGPQHFQSAHEDAAGQVWLGYKHDLVVVLDKGKARRYTHADGVDIGRIKVIRGRGPHMWLGGELGLSLFRDGRFHTIKAAGLELATVSGIVEAKNGDLWLNELHGIVHVASDEVRELLLDPRHAAVVEVLDHRDGMPGAPQLLNANATAVEASDGRLWFATDNGLARIDPAAHPKNLLAPPVAIRSVTADGKAYDVRSPFRLPPRTGTLEIEYTALSLTIPERVRFRYRLEGLDREWREAGNRRTAIFTNPPPGSFRFHVIACNEDGVWNEEGASLPIAIVPAFTQTRAFVAVCAAAAFGLAFAFYRWRVAEMRARLDLRFQERLAERTRIARDLHDTLLQGVLSASMQLRVAADQVPAEAAGKPRLDRVLELMDIVGAEGRNALRGLRARLTDHDDLEAAFSRIRHEVDAPEDVVYKVFGEGHPRPLLPIARDGIYRIGREAVVNAFRHARARHIEVEVRFDEDAVTLLVRDDGCGIADEVLRSGRRNHWGLSGMRERAEELGAALTLRTREGSGTELELVIPARIAFRPGTDAGARGLRTWIADLVKRPEPPG